MRIRKPDPKPRDNGDYRVETTSGYGKPTANIFLDEAGELQLAWLCEGDCERLIRAAARGLEEIRRYAAQMAAPHGRRHIYQGTCQLCGKPEDDELHAEPAASGPVMCGYEYAVDGVVRYCAGVTGHGGDHAGSDGTILPLEDHGEGDLASDIAAAAADSLPDFSRSHDGMCAAWHRDLFCWRPSDHDGPWHYDRVDGLAWRMDGSRLVTHTVPEADQP